MSIRRIKSQMSKNSKKGGNSPQNISVMFYDMKQKQAATYEQYAEIALAICKNPDCVNEVSIMDLVRIHLGLYNLSHPNVPLNIIVLAGGVIATRLHELERTTGLNIGANPPELAEVLSMKTFLHEACKNAIIEYNECDGWVYP